MAKNPPKKITTVREHPLRVPVSERNPTGITTRDRHLRRLKGTYLDAAPRDRMPHLKSSSMVLSMCLFITGCQSTPLFNIETSHTKVNDLHVIQVRADRVQQKCLFLNAEAENNWRHQYFMYILNEKYEVLEIMETTNQDKDTCYSQVQRIDKILQSESKVKICARDELKRNIQDPSSQNAPIQFGPLGKHKVTYEALTFDSICNSKKCISNNSVWVNTCPGFVKH